MYNQIHFKELNSTNTYLKENYEKLNDFTYVSVDYQTNGKGRNNRNWKSENGKNLLFSLLILDKDILKHYKEISIVAAYSICNILKEYGLRDISIKWPNDVYVNGKKSLVFY